MEKSADSLACRPSSAANDWNVELLVEAINLTKPERIICMGDLFHNYYNPEWEVFSELLKHFSLNALQKEDKVYVADH